MTEQISSSKENSIFFDNVTIKDEVEDKISTKVLVDNKIDIKAASDTKIIDTTVPDVVDAKIEIEDSEELKLFEINEGTRYALF